MGNTKVGCFVILVSLSVHGDVVGSATILVFILMCVLLTNGSPTQIILSQSIGDAVTHQIRRDSTK